MNRTRKTEIKQRLKGMLERRSLFFAFFIVLTGFASVAGAWDIPADRRITWQGNVGVQGGIPNRATICATISAATYGNGITDATSAINSAISSCPVGQVVSLPAGTYVITDQINLNKGISVRGAGPSSTILLANNTSMMSDIEIRGGYTSSSDPSISILSGYTKGSNQLVLADASAISAGNFLWLDELNDSSIPVSSVGYGGTCTWCGRDGTNGARVRIQIVKVTNKAGNTVTIDPPLYFSFSSGNSPLATKTPQYIEYAGIEDLTVQNGGTSEASLRNNIKLIGVANSWIKNVKVLNCGKRCITLNQDVYRNEVRDSYVSGCIDHTNSDQCYGVELVSGSGNLIENNIFADTSAAINALTATGNVIAYNYSYHVRRLANETAWFWPGDYIHGPHCSMNLWEGNQGAGIATDDYFGSSSYTTLFRNRYLGETQEITYSDGAQNIAAIATETNNHFNNIAGNILGTSGFSNYYDVKNVAYWLNKAIYASGVQGPSDSAVFTTMLRHMNYDYFTNSVKQCGDAGEPGCQGGVSDTALPVSFYRSSQPSWWNASPWPPIGPDVSGYVHNIPAKDRYEGTPQPTTHIVAASISGGNGTLSCTSPVNDGATTTCSASPASGYHTSSISGCGGTWSSGNSYTTGAITADCTVTAIFALNPVTVKPSAPMGLTVQ